MDSHLRLQTHRVLLANKSMKSASLQRHQSSKHTGSISRTEELYQPKLSLIRESKKPPSISKELILPTVTVLAEIMIDKKTVEALESPGHRVLSDLICRSVDIDGQAVNRMKQVAS